ncbi:MAG: hypothetical protein AB1696_19685 [Planctomycetota bacterium]
MTKRKNDRRSVQRLLWDPKRVSQEISAGPIFQHLDEPTRKELESIPVTELLGKVKGALQNPKPLDICRPVLGAVLAAQYYEVFQALGLPRNLAVYEPCVGGSVPVILAAEAHSYGKADYLTINLNQKLCAELKAKIGRLRMAIRIIEDNAQHALAHLEPNRFDVACFHHAVNDILETAVSEPRGMNTITIDWFPNERQMIEWLAEDVASGRIKERGKPELLQIIGDAVNLVRPGGYLLFDHYNWCKYMNVDWFPWQLFYDLIPMTREWIAESGLPLVEEKLPNVDPQWWMIMKVKK